MAAATFTKVRATAHSLVYTVADDNTGTLGTRTFTQLVSDAAAGPLKALLQQVIAGTIAFGALNAANSKIRLYVSFNAAAVPAMPINDKAVFTATGLDARMQNAGSACAMTVELRFLQSAIR